MLRPKSHEGENWPQVLAVFAESVSMFTAGLHTGWPAPSIPKLLSEEYPFDVTNDEASYITIMGFLGNLCGGFGNFLVDRIGRKRTILLMAIPQIISFTLIALSYYVKELLYFARFSGGVGEGMAFTIVPLYAAEIVDPRIRGRLSAILGIMLYFGVLFANLVGSYITIKVAALSFLVFPVIFLISFWKMPESPYFLLMKGKEDEAEKALKFLRWKSDVGKELTVLKMDVTRQMSETGSFRDIFCIESNRKALLVSIGARFSQVAPGMAAFNLYIQVLLSDATDSISSDIGASIVLLIQVLMTLVSTFTIDKWGRKPLLLFSICGCFLNLLIQTIYFVFKDYTSVDVSIIDWFPLVMMVLHIILYSLGLGMVTTIMISEMFSASVKGKLTCLVNAFYAIWSLCATKFYQATADGFGLVVPFASFGFMSLLGILFILFYVPETKGKSLEEIQQRFKRKKKKIEPIT